MRLIDADALETHEQLEPCGNGKYEYSEVVYKDDIDNAPTIEPELTEDDWKLIRQMRSNYNGTYAKVIDKLIASAQPEPIWGLHASVGRPLGDREIVPRLREIQKQIGGSYAIDRAVEVIEAIAERRTDD